MGELGEYYGQMRVVTQGERLLDVISNWTDSIGDLCTRHVRLSVFARAGCYHRRQRVLIYTEVSVVELSY